MVIDLTRKESRALFLDRFASGGQPVYVIGATTNMDGNFNNTTRDAYIALRMKGIHALLGQWTDPDGRQFRYTVFVVSGIKRREALTFKRLYDQQEILVVAQDGIRSISTETIQEHVRATLP